MCFFRKKNRAKCKKGNAGGSTFKRSVEYTGQKLYEKGVIEEIEGLPKQQFKHVVFEFKAEDENGLFIISGKFMGVTMEKVEIIFQDLLQLRFKGVAEKKMFGKTKFNVDLLISLINKKFYGK